VKTKGLRPATAAQAQIIDALQQQGYEVIKTGHPTLIARKGADVRWIVVNGADARVEKSPRQRRWEAVTGITTEVIMGSVSGRLGEPGA